MKQKRRLYFTVLVLVFLAAWWGLPSNEGPVTFASEGNILAKKTASDIRKQQNAKRATFSVVAYYFHGNYRCYTCKKIEQYSREAIERYYARELREKKLEFRPVNVDEKENRHFIQDYQLYTRSLVIVLNRKDRQVRWKNLPDVWSYVGDREKFYQYVKTELDAMLREAK